MSFVSNVSRASTVALAAVAGWVGVGILQAQSPNSTTPTTPVSLDGSTDASALNTDIKKNVTITVTKPDGTKFTSSWNFVETYGIDPNDPSGTKIISLGINQTPAVAPPPAPFQLGNYASGPTSNGGYTNNFVLDGSIDANGNGLWNITATSPNTLPGGAVAYSGDLAAAGISQRLTNAGITQAQIQFYDAWGTFSNLPYGVANSADFANGNLVAFRHTANGLTAFVFTKNGLDQPTPVASYAYLYQPPKVALANN